MLLLTPPVIPHTRQSNIIDSTGARAATKKDFLVATLSFEAFARRPGLNGVSDVVNKFLGAFLKPHVNTLVRALVFATAYAYQVGG